LAPQSKPQYLLRMREREINYPHLAETTNLGPTHG
jgi:hypothetical protein